MLKVKNMMKCFSELVPQSVDDRDSGSALHPFRKGLHSICKMLFKHFSFLLIVTEQKHVVLTQKGMGHFSSNSENHQSIP